MKGITPRHYVCPRAAAPLQIDGQLNEESWKTAAWTADFVDIEGDAKPKPGFRTRAKMLWDDDYLYLAAELEEPHVWGTLTNHDAVIFQDPDFEVFIDPDGDSHDYYEFEMNALNTTWDLLMKKPYKDGGPALNQWEIPGLKTAVHVNGTINNPADRDTGWTLEIAFPWKALGEHARCAAPPKEGHQWRINFSRVEWLVTVSDGKYHKVPGKKEDNWVWSPQGIVDMHRPEKWGYVQFTSKKPVAARFVPDPAMPAREVLQEIYYAQRTFHSKNSRWAASLAELGLAEGIGAKLAKAPVVSLTPGGFRATAGVRGPNRKLELWHIGPDARVWTE